MERRSEQDTNLSGPPSQSELGEAPYTTAEDTLHYERLMQRRQFSRPPQENAPIAPQLHGFQNDFRSGHLIRGRPPPTPRLVIPREPLSEDELRQRLLSIATRLQTTPDPAASASTDEADNQCGICRDVLVGPESDAPTAIKFNHCKHALHEQCVVEWLDWVQRNQGQVHQATCPHCRRLIFARQASTQTRRSRLQISESVAREVSPSAAQNRRTVGLVQAGPVQPREAPGFREEEIEAAFQVDQSYETHQARALADLTLAADEEALLESSPH